MTIEAAGRDGRRAGQAGRSKGRQAARSPVLRWLARAGLIPARPLFTRLRPATATIEPMRRNSCTVIVLASPVPPEVLGTVGRSMNVTLVRPAEAAGSDDDAGGLAEGPGPRIYAHRGFRSYRGREPG